ncbi:MAG TPA: hypothetical protein DCM59_09005, partial [Clostridium sp.]|nr:hypothetical protein [Clostridium sp.]
MNIKDSIYGEFIIEPVLDELINTKEVQRLKNIHQGGASYLVNTNWNVTRYEHSIGVMLLIRIMGGSIQEQIAGLLHDISHTAFSHVVDFALENKDEDYHEKIFEDIIENSIIPHILKNYGYDYRDIVYNESKWTILEKSAPDLCADRIDYTLRDMFNYGFISKKEIEEFLKHLILFNDELMISSIELAEWFVETYYKEVIGFFMNPLNVYGNDKLSKAIKVAIRLGEVDLNDMLMDDEYVFKLLKKSKSREVFELVESLNNNARVIEDSTDYDIHQVNKLRLIDPKIVIEQ